MLNTAQQQFDRPAYAMTRGSIVASVRGKKLTVNGDVDHGRRWASRQNWCVYIYIEWLALRVPTVRGHGGQKCDL